MRAPPMLRWQNAVALVATLLAAAALLPLEPVVRIRLVAAACATIVLLLAMRVRAHSARRAAGERSGTYERIARIRAQRAKRTR